MSARRFMATLLLAAVASIPRAAEDQRLDVHRPVGAGSEIPRDSAPHWTWRVDLGHGYSSPAVSDDRFFCAFHRDGLEGVAAFDLTTGRKLWEQTWSESFEGDGYGPGPNAPLQWVGEKILVTGVGLEVRLLEPGDGRTIWRRNLVSEEGATVPGHGSAAGAFLSDTGTLLYGLGGRAPAPVLALDAATGATLWRRGSLHVGYATPGRFSPRGESEQAVFYTTRATVGLDPNGGRELWRLPHPAVPTWNASLTPLQVDDELLFTATRSDTHNGSRGIRVRKAGSAFVATEAWFDGNLSIEPVDHVVISGDRVLATVGGGRSSPLVEIDVADGSSRTLTSRLGDASLIAAGNRILALDERGTLTALERTGERLWSFDIEARRSWTMPLLSGSLVIIRTRSELGVLDLRAE